MTKIQKRVAVVVAVGLGIAGIAYGARELRRRRHLIMVTGELGCGGKYMPEWDSLGNYARCTEGWGGRTVADRFCKGCGAP
jgi:hypothetical protein